MIGHPTKHLNMTYTAWAVRVQLKDKSYGWLGPNSILRFGTLDRVGYLQLCHSREKARELAYSVYEKHRTWDEDDSIIASTPVKVEISPTTQL